MTITRQTTIKELLSMGIVSIKAENFLTKRTFLWYSQNFEEGNVMYQFVDYSIERMEEEFSSVLYFTV